MRAIAPKGALEVVEEVWNCYLRCKTVISNPIYKKDKFSITIETIHKENYTGKINNIHNLLPELNLLLELLAKPEVVIIVIVNDRVEHRVCCIVCMYMCVACIYVFYICVYVCIMYVCVYYVYMCVLCMYVCVCVCVYLCNVCINCVYVCMCYVICVCRCMHVCVYVVCVYVVCVCMLHCIPLTHRITNLMKTHPSSSELKLVMDRYNQIGWNLCTYLHMYTIIYVRIVMYYISSKHKPTQILLYILCLHIIRSIKFYLL